MRNILKGAWKKTFKQKVSMIRKYHNRTLQTVPRHREEQPQNIIVPNHL